MLRRYASYVSGLQIDLFLFYYSSFGSQDCNQEPAKSEFLTMFKKIKNPNFIYSVKPFTQSSYPAGKPATAVSAGDVGPLQTAPPPVWEGRAIATHKLRLVEYSAFMESQNRDEAVSRSQKYRSKIIIFF